jgi:hypothetical protein
VIRPSALCQRVPPFAFHSRFGRSFSGTPISMPDRRSRATLNCRASFARRAAATSSPRVFGSRTPLGEILARFWYAAIASKVRRPKVPLTTPT